MHTIIIINSYLLTPRQGGFDMSDFGKKTGFDQFHRWTEHDFPESFPKNVVDVLMQCPGWMRYYPTNGHSICGTVLFPMLLAWSVAQRDLLGSLKALTNPDESEESEDTRKAVCAVNTALRNQMEDLDDILTYYVSTQKVPGYSSPMREKGKLLVFRSQSEVTAPDEEPTEPTEKPGK
jgi:hypothetical protein